MLQTTKAKPNPSGKDRSRFFTPQQQLAGEWIDIQNTGSLPISLNNLEVYHLAYKMTGTEWEKVIVLSGMLPAGKIVRIHSGREIPLLQLLEIDRIGAEYHIFTGKNYVWNNDQVDKPSIFNSQLKKWEDQTWYDKYPPEGIVLKRDNGKLVPL